MFSKKWLEQCSQSITTYETPAKDNIRSEVEESDIEDESEKTPSTGKRDWKEYLIKLKKRREEE